MRHTRLLAPIGAVMILAACAGGGGGESVSAGDGAGAITVDVTLQEWAVVVSEESVPAGEVTFAITNDGPEDVHEFVILRTDLDVEALPTDEDGAVDEDGDGVEVVDEVEDVAVGDSAELMVTLEAGSYALVCNVTTKTRAKPTIRWACARRSRPPSRPPSVARGKENRDDTRADGVPRRRRG